MAISKDIIADNQVLSWEAGLTKFTSVPISSGLYCDTVITGIKVSVFNKHIIAVFRITAVIVVAVGVNMNTSGSKIGAKNRI